MKTQTLIQKPLPQKPDILVSVPDYKEPILPVAGGFGWYGLQAYDIQGEKLMCHECGEFFDRLAHHTKTHKIKPKEYKRKYGLLMKSKLVSTQISQKFRTLADKVFSNPEFRERMKLNLTHPGRPRGKTALELLNKNDTCPSQLIRWLIDASKVYGDKISEDEANVFRSGLAVALHRMFGSFNKAKQIAKLHVNASADDKKIPIQIILEDMIAFYRKNQRWSTKNDYVKGSMICSASTIYNNGGFIKLRQESQRLKDEQDKRSSIDIKGIQNRIEMQYAGRARV